MTVLFVLGLFVVYALIICGLTFLYRLLRVPRNWAVLAAFLTFAAGTAFWAIAKSPYDVAVLINLPAVYLGEGIYGLSIRLFGDPHSSQAHYTIHWLLRVPQVFMIASIISWGLVGLVAQTLYNYLQKKRSQDKNVLTV